MSNKKGTVFIKNYFFSQAIFFLFLNLTMHAVPRNEKGVTLVAKPDLLKKQKDYFDKFQTF